MNRGDEQLGTALRELRVPEHAPGFFKRLERELDSADLDAPNAAASDLGVPDPLSRPVPRRPGARRRWFERAGGRPLTWGLAAATVAAIVLIAVMVVPRGLLPDRVADDLGPGIATAAEIKAKVAAALDRAKTLRGVLVVVGRDDADATQSEMRWDFATTARGDFLLRGSNVMQNGETRVEELAYDVGTGSERAWSREGETAPIGGERTGLAAGPPDPGPSEWILHRNLAGVVRALLAAAAPSVSETTYEGRPAWLLSTPVDRDRLSTYSADRMEVTVEQATGFPVRVVETQGGDLVQEIRLERLEIDPDLADGTFSIEFPEGMEAATLDAGFRRVAPTEAAAAAGYAPPLPTAVPDGFELALISVADEGQPTGKEGMNPPAHGVVSSVYRRGFDELLVSSRLVGDDPGLWSDPLAGGEGFIDRPERVTLRAGAFADHVAEVLIDPRSQMPHLWVMDGKLVVTVAGDLSRAELIATAESLTTGGAQ